MNDTDRAADFWSKARQLGESRFHWITHPVTRAHINHRVSGDHSVDVIAYWQEHFMPAVFESVLSLGCGFGEFERMLATRGIAQHIVGLDVSPGAIEGAKEAATEAGLSEAISYEVADLNTIDMGTERFDAIFGIGSVHHVFQLEQLFNSCRSALGPQGLLFLDEYIGVSRWQVSDDLLALMNSILSLLPARLRQIFGTNPVEFKDWMYRTDLSWFDNNDPSESVRSAEILSTVKVHFDVIDFRPYGGAILHLLLSMIAGNFDESSEEDRTLLELLILMERELERSGRIGSDFAALVCSPKDPPAVT